MRGRLPIGNADKLRTIMERATLHKGPAMGWQMAPGSKKGMLRRWSGSHWVYKPHDSPAVRQTQDDAVIRALKKRIARRPPGQGAETQLSRRELAYILKKGRYGLVSAGKNPKLEPTMGQADQKARHEKLRKELVSKGLVFTEVEGHYEGKESTFLVMAHEATRAEVREIGKAYNQDSVIYADSGKQEMYFTTGENDGQHLKGTGYLIKPTASDYYTEIPHPEGGSTKFALNFDWDTMHKAVRYFTLSKAKYTKRIPTGDPKRPYKYVYDRDPSHRKQHPAPDKNAVRAEVLRREVYDAIDKMDTAALVEAKAKVNAQEKYWSRNEASDPRSTGPSAHLKTIRHLQGLLGGTETRTGNSPTERKLRQLKVHSANANGLAERLPKTLARGDRYRMQAMLGSVENEIGALGYTAESAGVHAGTAHSAVTAEWDRIQGQLKGMEKQLRERLAAGRKNAAMKKAGVYIGPRGGRYSDPQHKIPYKEGSSESGVRRKAPEKPKLTDRSLDAKVQATLIWTDLSPAQKLTAVDYDFAKQMVQKKKGFHYPKGITAEDIALEVQHNAKLHAKNVEKRQSYKGGLRFTLRKGGGWQTVPNSKSGGQWKRGPSGKRIYRYPSKGRAKGGGGSAKAERIILAALQAAPNSSPQALMLEARMNVPSISESEAAKLVGRALRTTGRESSAKLFDQQFVSSHSTRTVTALTNMLNAQRGIHTAAFHGKGTNPFSNLTETQVLEKLVTPQYGYSKKEAKRMLRVTQDQLQIAKSFTVPRARFVIKADKIPGGLADKKKPSDFDPKALAAGIEVEMEHTNSRAIATEIAMDHLTEDPRYYEKLKTIEKSFRVPLIKGVQRGGKYFKRVPTGNPKRPWKYYYTRAQWNARNQSKGKSAKEKTAEERPTQGVRHWVSGADFGLKVTKSEHTDASGNYTKQRLKLHQQIQAKFSAHVAPVPKDRRPVALITMGGPAAGKGTVVRAIMRDTSDFVLVNPDDVKEEMPEYKKGLDLGKDADGKPISARDAAWLAHDESSDIASKIEQDAIRDRKNVLIDGTGKNAAKYERKIEALRKAGYRIKLVMPHLPLETAVTRVEQRAEATGRYVPEDIVRHAHTVIPGNFERIARAADEFTLFSNDSPPAPPPKEMWSGGAGKEDTVRDPQFVAGFKTLAERSQAQQSMSKSEDNGGDAELPDSVSMDELLARIAKGSYAEEKGTPGDKNDGVFQVVEGYEAETKAALDKKAGLKKSQFVARKK